jgi:hypothetical protein
MRSKINIPSGPISGGQVSAQVAKQKNPLRGSGGSMHPSFRRGKLVDAIFFRQIQLEEIHGVVPRVTTVLLTR